MKLNLTLNKPAITALMTMSNGAIAGLKLKVADGKLFVKPVSTDTGAGVFPVFTRTRGGMGVTLTGKFCEQFITQTNTERGSHFQLSNTSHNWVAGEPLPVGDKPSKLHPTARIWRMTDEIQTKSDKAPVVVKVAKVAKVAKVVKVAQVVEAPVAKVKPVAIKAKEVTAKETKVVAKPKVTVAVAKVAKPKVVAVAKETKVATKTSKVAKVVK